MVEGKVVGRVGDKVVGRVGGKVEGRVGGKVGVVVGGQRGEQLGERGGFSEVGLVDCMGVDRVAGEQEPIGGKRGVQR